MPDYKKLQNGSDIRGVAIAVEGGKPVDLTEEAVRAIGGAFAGACMAGLAYLMARHGLSQAAAWPMASAAVCAGSLLSGWLAAFFQRSRGLVCGAIQGAMFVLLLTGFGLYAGFAPAEMQFVRFALVFLFGCLGGIFGMLRTERRHH